MNGQERTQIIVIQAGGSSIGADHFAGSETATSYNCSLDVVMNPQERAAKEPAAVITRLKDLT